MQGVVGISPAAGSARRPPPSIATYQQPTDNVMHDGVFRQALMAFTLMRGHNKLSSRLHILVAADVASDRQSALELRVTWVPDAQKVPQRVVISRYGHSHRANRQTGPIGQDAGECERRPTYARRILRVHRPAA